MTEHTADLLREEIARPLTTEEEALMRSFAFTHEHASIDGQLWGRPGIKRLFATLDALRSQDTATARIAELEGALRAVLDAGDAFDMADSSYALGLANGSIVAATKLARAVLSGETRTGGETVE